MKEQTKVNFQKLLRSLWISLLFSALVVTAVAINNVPGPGYSHYTLENTMVVPIGLLLFLAIFFAAFSQMFFRTWPKQILGVIVAALSGCASVFFAYLLIM